MSACAKWVLDSGGSQSLIASVRRDPIQAFALSAIASAYNLGAGMSCSSCGASIEAGATSCSHCGTALSPAADATGTATAPAPVAAPAPPAGPQAATYCRGCGAGLVATAVTCPQCGTPAGPVQPVTAKKKSTAVLLAVFLSFWTWCYTYKVDAWKFWLNLVLGVLTVGIWTIFVGYWWAIIDAARRPASFYENFPNG